MEMALAYRQFAKENPELYKIFIRSASLEDPKLSETGRTIVTVIYKVLQPYHCNQEDLLHFTRGFRSALHGFVSLEAAGFFLGEADMNESFFRMVKGCFMLLDNIGKEQS